MPAERPHPPRPFFDHSHLLIEALLPAVLAGLALAPALDLDLWWHLRTGKAIVESGLPHRELFSFTARGVPWTTHEWLTQVLMWRLYESGGLPMLSVAFALSPVAAFVLAYKATARSAYPILVAMTLLAALSSVASFGVRPQVITLLFAALFGYALRRQWVERQPARFPPWLLVSAPIVSIAWANLHGGYLLGGALIIAYGGAEWLDASCRGSAKQVAHAAGRAALCGVLCIVAGLANPYGLELWATVADTLGHDWAQQHVAEWQPPDIRRPSWWPFAVYLAAGVASWAGPQREGKIRDLLIFLPAAFGALTSQRHIPLFAILTVPIVSANLSAWAGWTRRTTQSPGGTSRRTRFAALVASAALVVAIVTLRSPRVMAYTQARMVERYPVRAIDHLEEAGLTRLHGFHPYDWGGYLIFRGVPTLVDGRCVVFPEDLLRQSTEILLAKGEWRAFFNKHDIGWALLPRGAPLSTVLDEAEEWTRAHRDDVAEVWVPARSADTFP